MIKLVDRNNALIVSLFNYIRPTKPSTNVDSSSSQYHTLATVTPVDPVEKVKGMYRLLDLIDEFGSNGYDKRHLSEPDTGR